MDYEATIISNRKSRIAALPRLPFLEQRALRGCSDVDDDGIMPTICYPCFDIAAVPRFYIVSRSVCDSLLSPLQHR